MRFLAFFIELESMAILFEYTTGGSIITDSPLSIYVCLTSNPYRQFSHAGVESMDGNVVPRAAGDHALFIQGIRVDEASLTSGNSVLELSKMRPQLRATSHNRQ